MIHSKELIEKTEKTKDDPKIPRKPGDQMPYIVAGGDIYYN